MFEGHTGRNDGQPLGAGGSTPLPVDISELEPHAIVDNLQRAAAELATRMPELSRQLVLSSYAVACDEGVFMAMLHNGALSLVPPEAVRVGVRRELLKREGGMGTPEVSFPSN